jgi:hypothetical protein
MFESSVEERAERMRRPRITAQVATTLRVAFVPKRATDARVLEGAWRRAGSHRGLAN